MASQLAYSGLFALFPFFISVVAFASYLPINDLVDKLIEELAPFVPATSLALISQNLHEVVLRRHAGLLSLSFALALWSSSSAVAGLMTGLNQVYGVEDNRSVLMTRGLSLLVTVGADLAGIVAAVVLVGGGSAGAWLSRVLGAPTLYSRAWNILRWPAAAALMLGLVLILYVVLPDVKLRFRDVLWGALAAVGMWLLATLGFSFYLAHFPNFGAAYGSLGTAVVLLTWLYINGLVLILGGQINALIADARGVRPPRRQHEGKPGVGLNAS